MENSNQSLLSPKNIYIAPTVLALPTIKTKKQLLIEIKRRHANNVLKKYKQSCALKQSRRNKFHKYWIYMKQAKGELITKTDQNEWQQLRERLKNCGFSEYRAQLSETRKWLKLKEIGCARVLNFYPGARKLKF